MGTAGLGTSIIGIIGGSAAVEPGPQTGDTGALIETPYSFG